MERLNINIAGVYKAKWRNNGDFISDNHKIIYAGEERSERGVRLILDRKCILGYWQMLVF